MMSTAWCRIVLLVAVSLLGARGGLFAQDRSPIEVRAIASHTEVPSGGRLVAGALFSIPKGWHIYWRYPGASGLPTKISFSGGAGMPAGFSTGQLEWPIPDRFEQPGVGDAFGYSGEVFLGAQVAVGDGVLPGSYQIPLSVSWLSCSDVCIREQRDMVLSLQVGAAETPSKGSLAAIARWREQLPLPAESSALVQSLAVTPAIKAEGRIKGTAEVVLARRGAVEWFPVVPRGVRVLKAEYEPTEQGGRVVWELALPAGEMGVPSSVLEGVLVVASPKGRSGITITVPVRES